MEIPIPKQAAKTSYCANSKPHYDAFALASLANQNQQPLLVISHDMQTAYRLRQEMAFFVKDVPIYIFPDWETLPYDVFSPHQDLISERLGLLNQLPHWKNGVVIASVSTLLHHLPPIDFIQANSLVLKIGDRLDLNKKRQQLEQAGYYCVKQVVTRGEFALRGSILDIFPMGSKQPFRIELFDDEVETIRSFDPESQRSAKQIEAITLLPAREFPLNPDSANLFEQNWKKQFAENTWDSPLLQAILKQQAASGAEYYLPLFFGQTCTLLDYLPGNSLLAVLDGVHMQADQFKTNIDERFIQMQYSLEHPALASKLAFYSPSDFFHQCHQFAQVRFEQKLAAKTNFQRQNLNLSDLPDLRINTRLSQPLSSLHDFIAQGQYKILFLAATAGRRQILLEHLQKIDIVPSSIEHWQPQQSQPLAIGVAPLERGFIIEELNLALISENDLFSDLVLQRRRQEISKDQDSDRIAVRDLTELNCGDAVVHLNHGVGRYQGLTTLDLGGQLQEFLTLVYANENKLYVPINDLHLISRYSSAHLQHAPINHLGSDRWHKSVEKAAKRVRDIAAELLEIYAKRESRQGFRCKLDQAELQQFADDFPFEETADQTQAIAAVIADMCLRKPMDRLLCGDVGFGKTEVAMRAAFVAVYNKKQVAILVPTTLLARQHFESFSDRFANWPVQIESLSRFKTAKQQSGVVAKLKSGQIDIVIGTHKLLNKSIVYKDLGLLVIDEEHRFGVRDKEKLKAMRADVDILTMTATPIPRTLNMAMSQIRDLSLITTPPARRLSVKTFVKSRGDDLLKEAITREIMRGGQVYFLHNDVATINHAAEQLQLLLPQLKIGIGHGQMRERELEQVMADFYHNRHQLLLCTTIIETGIDIPNANTIIIDRADKLGLAQLHQLRGRVGRSHHQAYAYLLCPEKTSLTGDAKKRLFAVESAKSLGAGFELASHDLEIRGAGELLGDEQSGHMTSIGFNLYLELLNQAVKAMQKGENLDLDRLAQREVEIDLGLSALIPDNYLGDVNLRLQLYKRISNAKNERELDQIQIEMIDRFGLLPEQAKNLFAQTLLRLQARAIGIKQIQANKQSLSLEFLETPKINPSKIIQWVQKNSRHARFAGNHKIRLSQDFTEEKYRIETAQQVLAELG